MKIFNKLKFYMMSIIFNIEVFYSDMLVLHNLKGINNIKNITSSKESNNIWIILFILGILILTACSQVQQEIPVVQEVNKPYVCEKTFNTTQYKEVRTPFGEPRCEQTPYNFTKISYNYNTEVIDGKTFGKCTFLMKNEEDIEGTFEFYPNIFKDGKISDGPQIIKKLQAFQTKEYSWSFKLDNSYQSANCMIQASNPPYRVKCFYLEPVIYETRKVPQVVQEKRNVTC